MPNIVKGGNMPWLVRYLVGKGHNNEHTNQHLVAGSKEIMHKWGAYALLNTRQATDIARKLDQYMRETRKQPLGTDKKTGAKVPRHVWHCSLSLKPEEGQLSDETWSQIANDFVTMMGFTGDGVSPCRWVAVRHGLTVNGGDHIHIAVNIVRQDGHIWDVHDDQPNAQKACKHLEEKYGLEVLESRHVDRGARDDSQEALQAAAKHGLERTDRAELEERLRIAATASYTEVEFIEHARELGVRVRPRFAKGDLDRVEGYSAALYTTDGRDTTWFAGSKIAKDLNLKMLRRRWPQSNTAQSEAVQAWRNVWAGLPPKAHLPITSKDWQRASDTVEHVIERLASIDPTNTTELADIAHDTSGLLAAQARASTNPTIARAFHTAAKSLGANAQLNHHQSQRTYRLELVGVTRLLMTAATAGSPLQGARLAGDIMRLTAAVIAAHQAAGQANTAATMLKDTQAAWDAIHTNTPLANYVDAINVFTTYKNTTNDPTQQHTPAPEHSTAELTPEHVERIKSILAATTGTQHTQTPSARTATTGTPRHTLPRPHTPTQ